MANRFSGRKTLTEKLTAIGSRTGQYVGRALDRGSQAIADHAANAIMSPPKTGRIYRSKHRKGAFHQASAPGEAPAGDSGKLQQSLTHVRTANGPAVYRSEVGANAPQALRLELGGYSMAANATVSGKGTPDKKLRTPKKGPVRIYIAPRPFMGPAYDANEAAIRQSIRTAIKRGAKEGSGR